MTWCDDGSKGWRPVHEAEPDAKPLKAFTAGLGVETNTFSPLDVGLDAFAQTFLYHAGGHPDALTEVSAPLHVLRQRRDHRGWGLTEGLYAFALPAGRVTRDAYETLRDEILRDLAAGAPYDLVAFSMHGAMCAVGYDDCEGDLLARARSILGPDTPVGVELDPHAHLSDAMVRHADVLIAFKEYPHTDFLERGVELIDLLERCARTGWRPAKAVFDCRTIGRFHTMREPMRGLVRRMQTLEAQPGVASVSLIHGFPWGDVADLGAQVLVYANEAGHAEAVAAELGQALIAIRDHTFSPPLDLDAALDSALAAAEHPVVIADVSDNPGGGASGDSTRLLQRLLTRDCGPACLGPFWDPAAVQLARRAGVGARVALRLGGKGGPAAGEPFEVEALVIALSDELHQSWAGTRMSLGPACALRIGAVDVVVGSIRDQAYGPDLFTALGIDPARRRLVVVKSAQHFMAGFSGLAARVVLASGGGSLETDFRKIPYQNVRRPIWPLD